MSTSPLTRALRRSARARRADDARRRARAHASHREAHAIAALARAGVDVREGGANEKLALAGDAAWIGSCNATGAAGRVARQLEWGLVTRDPALVSAGAGDPCA